jgi:hypothetical protein
LPRARLGSRQPLLATGGRGEGTSILWVRFSKRKQIRFEYETNVQPVDVENETKATDFSGVGLGFLALGFPVSLPVSKPADLTLEITVRMDPIGYVSVFVGDRLVLAVDESVARGPITLGGIPDRPSVRFAGDVRRLPTATPLCDQLRRLEHETTAS